MSTFREKLIKIINHVNQGYPDRFSDEALQTMPECGWVMMDLIDHLGTEYQIELMVKKWTGKK